MIINTTIPLVKADNYPARQVGKKALEFTKVNKAKINIASGFVIPTETFKQIAHHNHLLEKIKLVEETNDWNSELLQKKFSGKISSLIKKQKFPEDVAKDIIRTYHKYIAKGSFAQINSSKVILGNISGEANFLESILVAWSNSATKETLLKTPQLILVQNQPIASGFVKPSKEKKNRYVVKATYGVFDKQLGVNNKPDVFEIDSLHSTIVTRHLHPRKIELKRKLDGLSTIKSKKVNQASLTDSQAIEIATSVAKINRLFIGSRKISFVIDKKKPIISNIDKIIISSQQESDPILIGQSITGGYVEGYPQIINTRHDSLSFTTGHILVKKTLTHLDLNLINHASAIILEEKKLTPAILKAIKDNHIPCMIGVTHATTKLHAGHKVVVDTGAGKIYPSKKEEKTSSRSKKTLTKVYLSAGNPFREKQYQNHKEGIFLKSDYAIAFMGVHPNHLLKNRKHLLEKNLIKTIKTFFTKDKKNLFYRSCNLNSSEFRSLSNSLNYEKVESSPYIGTRGALKIIEDSLLFTTELKIVSDIAHEMKRAVNFVIPFVRTSSELAIIFKIIEKTIPKNRYVKFWLQLNTPANVINLNEYLHYPISGVTYQAKTINDLTYGLDPDNPELLNHYSFDSELAITMLNEVVTTIKKSKGLLRNTIGSLPVILKLNQYNSHLLTKAVQLGVRAVVVKPTHFDIVKQQIVSTENKMVTSQ